MFFWFLICVFLPRQDSVDGTAVGRHHDFGIASGQGGFHHLHHPGANHPNFRRPVATRGSHSSDTSSAYSGSDTMQVCKIILFYCSHAALLFYAHRCLMPYTLDSLNHAPIMTGSFFPPYTRKENFHLDMLRLLGSNPGRPRHNRALYPLLHGLC